MSTPRQLREQTQIGTDVARSPEAFGFVDGGDERERSQLTDPGYCHQPLAGPDERARRFMSRLIAAIAASRAVIAQPIFNRPWRKRINPKCRVPHDPAKAKDWQL